MEAVGWRDDEKAMAKVVLGSEAFHYLMSCPISGETDIGIIEDLTNKLSNLVELRDSNNSITWNYATFWKHTRSSSGELALVWGDGYCREPRDDEEPQVTRDFQIGLEEDSLQQLRKKVLHKLHISSGGSNEDSYILGLDHITDIEMLFLASMYFTFSADEGGPGKCFKYSKFGRLMPNRSFSQDLQTISRVRWQSNIRKFRTLERRVTRNRVKVRKVTRGRSQVTPTVLKPQRKNLAHNPTPIMLIYLCGETSSPIIPRLPNVESKQSIAQVSVDRPRMCCWGCLET